MPSLRRAILASVLAIATVLLTACTPTVSMKPAEHANDPLCAEVMVRLPKAIGEFDRVWTDAQATGAWGVNPPVVALTCGSNAPAPTAKLQCATLGGVDWLVDEEDFPNLLMTTYGRQPAVQVLVNTEAISSNVALLALASAVSQIPEISACVTPDELPEELRKNLSG